MAGRLLFCYCLANIAAVVGMKPQGTVGSGIVDNIKRYINARSSHGSSLDTIANCTLGEGETCPIERMNGPTLVYPGGDSACLAGPYAFLVDPGRTDKLLVDFEGGGACWDEWGFVNGLCFTSLEQAVGSSGFPSGVFNRSHRGNQFNAHTFVLVLYCSGDSHIGNVTHSWNGSEVQQVGYANAATAVQWAGANTNHSLSSLVLMGRSAGAVGVQLWSRYLLERFNYTRVAIIADSFAGVFPPGAQQFLFNQSGVYGTPLLTDAQSTSGVEGKFKLEEVFFDTIDRFPDASFGMIQSKSDYLQVAHYNTIVLTLGINASMLDAPELFYQSNLIFQVYALRENFAVFYVEGDTHTFTARPLYYVAGTLGTMNGSSHGQASLYHWTTDVGLRRLSPRSECAGPIEPNDATNGVHYCDEKLFRTVRPWPTWIWKLLAALVGVCLLWCILCVLPGRFGRCCFRFGGDVQKPDEAVVAGPVV
jgi:hypothetical protein